ncbi:MAG: prolyl oligopeptidase family serine peptidase [Cyanobacteria bacterium SZAS LIN-5]|nr:prolyl oligopeptidase family serine peptidase [Cyanobacteria bacterium SZAS LIN-5]
MIFRLALSLAILIGVSAVPLLAFSVEHADTRYATNSKVPKVLVMYFHALDSNCSEPFVVPTVKDSVSGRILGAEADVAIRSSNSNATDVFTGRDNYDNVTGIIRETVQAHPTIREVVLCGSSMGGYEALAYLHYAPKDVLDKITGVISVEPADDLYELYGLTRSDRVREVLRSAFEGDPRSKFSEYQSHSLPSLLSSVQTRRPMKVCVVSATQDQVVPPFQQRRLVRTLQSLNFDAQLLEINWQHGVKDPAVYAQAIQAVQRPAQI